MHTALLPWNWLLFTQAFFGMFVSMNSTYAVKNIDIGLGKEQGLAIVCDFGLIAIGYRHFITVHDQLVIQDHYNEAGYVVSIPLLEPLSDGRFVEFKFISKSQLFYCDVSYCSLCTLTTNVSSCTKVIISWNGVELSSMTSVSAVRSSERLFVRVIGTDRAAILSYPLQYSESMKSDQYATDAPYITDFSPVDGFSRGRHIYFVGSTLQPYEPIINANIGDENRTISKITRICNSDTTSQLESRMDLAIECGPNGVNQRVEASFYDPDRDRITIVVAANNSFSRRVCVFSMAEVEERFEHDWVLCQKSTLHERVVHCDIAASEADLDDQCYIFTRKADAYRMQICTRFGQEEHAYENCDLHRYVGSSYRYSWLEDFRPFKGELVATFDSDLDRIVSFVPDELHRAYFVAGYTNGSTVILRIPRWNDPQRVKSFAVWRKTSSPATRFAIGLSSSEEIIFILNSNVITLTSISCAGLYNTCNDLAQGGWFDPMSCVWCLDKQRQFVTSASDKLSCYQPISGVCPPIVNHANRNDNHSEWELYGSNLNTLENVKVFVCEKPCLVNKKLSSDSRLLCFLMDGSVQDASCTIRVVGRLGTYNDFTLYVEKTTHSVALMTDYLLRAKSSRTLKIVLAVVVVVIILIVLGVIVYLARNKMKISKKKNAIINSHLFGDAAVNENNSTKYNVCLMDYLSPYESMFRNIDERLKIDVSSLHFEAEIGQGHFGIVSRATYITPDGATRTVACKFLKESIAGVGDFILEGLTMDRFDHPHLMQLIGIAFPNGRTPIIVTEYMENGDLRSYLRDITKIITIRKLLRFAWQIAEGMKHLHQCRSVHCDLAARNCMLDADLNIKIGDFGLCRRVSDDSDAYKPSLKHRDVPFPWMAPETIRSETFTFQNDVWAYGVVLWELTTRGLTPYAGKKGIEILEFLRANNRLEMPEYCPPQLYNGIMMPCWHVDPQQRPTFASLVILLDNLISSMEKNQPNQLSCNYEKLSTLHNDSATEQSNQIYKCN